MSSATVAPSSILEPEQQQQAESSGSAWHSSGSVAPFFVVVSVLAILAVISCYLGRRLNGRAPTPLESITGRGCFGWVKRMCQRCSGSNEAEVGGVGAKVMACNVIDECNNNKLKVNGEVVHHNLTPV
ncbi:hypothetical protein HN51_063226 [Arachis hypogaea]|uniref:Uncharacterized protein n=1 Tax=Arachis hypogaea TaxID=3818 RepID=A0A445AZ06_ARAHY|nr:uncharacterized protein LOC107619444 [Arachis ipaensis]QHO20822.1 uncharacterized protein DS421_11g341320 [Arachis hypogaea]RYR31648.1 hypothetical protein Ahy_B01g056500 [Arachis hypogaea]